MSVLEAVLFYQPLHNFGAAMLGTFILYMLNRLNNRQPFSFFRALKMKLDGPKAIFSDMIISSALGAGLVILLFQPGTVPEAAAAGLGLTGILAAFGKEEL